jgi:hypothetical protein
VLPGPAPGLADRRVSLAPFSLERLEPDQRHINVLGAVDRLDGGQDRLLLLFGWPLTSRLAEPHSGAAAVLADELDAGGRIGGPPTLMGRADASTQSSHLETDAPPRAW